MSRSELLEIDRLAMEIADGVASADSVRRLDSMLRDRPDLQRRYARMMSLHLLLSYEFHLSTHRFQPILQPGPIVPKIGMSDVDQCVTLSTAIADDVSGRLAKRRALRRPPQFFAAAAVVFIALALGYVVWTISTSRYEPYPIGPQWADVVSGVPSPSSSQSQPIRRDLVVRDAPSLRLISRLTKTSTLTSVQLPGCPADEPPGITLCSGTAWMERSLNQRERGYVVALAPGYMLEVYVNTDADFQNSLSIVELGVDGRMTGDAISFSNSDEGDARVAKRRLGSIGKYSEYNDQSSVKYYLFTGSHRMPEQDEEEPWRLSDFKVQYDSDDLMVIGWDDSSYVEHPKPPGPSDQSPLPDHDYDDIRAILRFSRPGPSTQPSPTVRYSPEPDPELPLADPDDDGYPLDVKPGQTLMLLVSSSAALQNSVRIVEMPTRQIIWKDDGSEPGTDPAQATERGVCVIRNDSATVRRYEVQARHRPVPPVAGQEWQQSRYRLLASGEDNVIVGFEDRVTQPHEVDWNDIRVHALWLSD